LSAVDSVYCFIISHYKRYTTENVARAIKIERALIKLYPTCSVICPSLILGVVVTTVVQGKGHGDTTGEENEDVG